MPLATLHPRSLVTHAHRRRHTVCHAFLQVLRAKKNRAPHAPSPPHPTPSHPSTTHARTHATLHRGMPGPTHPAVSSASSGRETLRVYGGEPVGVTASQAPSHVTSCVRGSAARLPCCDPISTTICAGSADHTHRPRHPSPPQQPPTHSRHRHSHKHIKYSHNPSDAVTPLRWYEAFDRQRDPVTPGQHPRCDILKKINKKIAF